MKYADCKSEKKKNNLKSICRVSLTEWRVNIPKAVIWNLVSIYRKKNELEKFLSITFTGCCKVIVGNRDSQATSAYRCVCFWNASLQKRNKKKKTWQLFRKKRADISKVGCNNFKDDFFFVEIRFILAFLEVFRLLNRQFLYGMLVVSVWNLL